MVNLEGKKLKFKHNYGHKGLKNHHVYIIYESLNAKRAQV